MDQEGSGGMERERDGDTKMEGGERDKVGGKRKR